jgi:hypothetical protein
MPVLRTSSHFNIANHNFTVVANCMTALGLVSPANETFHPVSA